MKLCNVATFIIILITLNIGNSFACDIHGKSGILPINKMYIPMGLKSMGGITKEQFDHVLDKIERLFANIVKAEGADLLINKKWNDGTVNAFADRDIPGEYEIIMYGGFARHPAITEDAMALVACHELGHHIGGSPKKTDEFGEVRWAAVEGQADYWATMKCLRYYFQDENNQAQIKNLNIPSTVVKKCELIYLDKEQQAICQRSTMAGLALANVFKSVTEENSTLSFDTPDPLSVKGSTWEGHPRSQCRLDTYFQASLCRHDIKDTISDSDPNLGFCSMRNGDIMGNRPTCWYLPIN